jgi:hypothetical protein
VKPITAVLALLFLPVCWVKPRYGMLLLVALQVVFLGGSLQLAAEKFVYGAFFGILMLAWLPGLVSTRSLWIKHPITKWLMGVYGVVLISRVVGATNGIATLDWFRDFSPQLNYAWILLGVYAFGPEVDVRKYARFLLTGIAILAIPITLQWMAFREFIDPETQIIDNATLGPSVTLFGTFLSLAFVLDAKDKHTKRKYLAITGAFLAAALLSGTRINVASTMVGFFTYFLLFRHEHKISFKKAVSALAVPAALVMVAFAALAGGNVISTEEFVSRYGKVVTPEMLEDDTFKDRVTETLDAWNAFTERPIAGQGLGYKSETVYTVGTVSYQPEMYFMHNFYVYLLAKFGVTGFLVFLGFLISITRSAIKGYFRRTESFEKYYFGAMAALMTALMLESLAASQFGERLPTALLGIMVGMMVALDHQGRGLPEPVPAPAPGV